jgi:hypothetical protein
MVHYEVWADRELGSELRIYIVGVFVKRMSPARERCGFNTQVINFWLFEIRYLVALHF